MMEQHTATLFTGPMWAGKTTGIIDMAHAALAAGGAVAAIKWTGDDRTAAVQDHDGRRLDPRVAVARAPTLAAARAALPEGLALVVIDEGQFFPDLAAGVAALLAHSDVAVSALDADYHQRPFAAVEALRRRVGPAVRRLRARCGTPGCGAPAEHTVRLPHEDSPRVAAGDNPIAVGGAEMYRAACGACLARG